MSKNTEPIDQPTRESIERIFQDLRNMRNFIPRTPEFLALEKTIREAENKADEEARKAKEKVMASPKVKAARDRRDAMSADDASFYRQRAASLEHLWRIWMANGLTAEVRSKLNLMIEEIKGVTLR